jgi:hypothetical protein
MSVIIITIVFVNKFVCGFVNAKQSRFCYFKRFDLFITVIAPTGQVPKQVLQKRQKAGSLA